MSCYYIKILKAALISAAFLFPKHAHALNSFENIKVKTSELLVLKQKERAIQLLLNYLKTERSKPFKNEANELLYSVGQIFLSKEAQEEYESSINETIADEKSASKYIEKCLKLDPQNLDCLIQRARLFYRAKNDKSFAAAIDEIKLQISKSTFDSIFLPYLEKNNLEFKNRQIISVLPTQTNEKTLFYIVLETERSFEAKNYSRAKEVIGYAEKHYQDWPDIYYYKYRLNLDSTENQQRADDDLLTIYSNKCKSLSKSVARKYRYDFDLCNRGKKK